MSYGDLSPYDLDLGSGRVHTHIVVQPDFLFCRGPGSTARERLMTVICFFFLPFMNAVVFPLWDKPNSFLFLGDRKWIVYAY